MQSYMRALRAGAVLGAVLGAAIGAYKGSWLWPGQSLMMILRAAGLGWLIGIAASPILGLVVSRRAVSPRGGGRRPWRRVGGGVLTALALAPAALWVTVMLPDGYMRRAMQPGRRTGDERPNLLLITIDALRADHVGAYGSDRGLTPNLDAFAAEATRYDAAYVSSPWTLPSFGTIFSTLPPSGCGLKTTLERMHNWYLYSAKLPETARLFPEDLRDAGYVTAAELTNCFLAPERGWDKAFDYFRNEDGPELGAILTRADTVTKNALAWLRLHRREPFFLWIHYLDPHVPYNSPDTPKDLRAQYPSNWLTRREYWYGKMVQQDEETKRLYGDFCRAMYAEEVRFADRWVGKLLAGIKAAGLWDSSLIVITSDHGEELFDHGHFEHGHSLYEEVLRVPLLVKWPRGFESDEEVMQTVGLIALGPTFLDAAGLPSEKTSVRPLPQRDGEADMEVFSEGMFWGTERTALTTGDYKIIYHPHRTSDLPVIEVYDRRDDRSEHHDLASDPAEGAPFRDRLAALTAESETAAKRWKPSGKREFRGIDLSDATREKLRTLGYIGD